MAASSDRPIPIPERIDGRSLAVILYSGIVVVVTLLGDRSVFEHPPRHFVERIASVPIVVFYPFVDDRLTATIAGGIAIALALALPAAIAWIGIQRLLVEPLHMRKVVQTTIREEHLYNHFRSLSERSK